MGARLGSIEARTMYLARTLSGRRVLVVEDDYLLAEAVAAELRARDVDVVGPVGTVEAALAIVAGVTTLDAVVLDMNLAGQPGHAVADAVLARGLPLVLTTGYDQSILPERFAGTSHCLKPIDADDVVAALSGRFSD